MALTQIIAIGTPWETHGGYLNFASRTYFQILLHDPLEFPMIQDGGFVVSPGFETFASIQQIRVSGFQVHLL